MSDVIKVAERLYREANPNGSMDTPSFAYQQVESANRRRIQANSDFSLYEWCLEELKKKG